MPVKDLRTRRDNQQWMLDLALNMRGRVQNFERDDWETPKRAHNYRMLPKMWRQKGEHDERLAIPRQLSTTIMQLKPTVCHSTQFSTMTTRLK